MNHFKQYGVHERLVFTKVPAWEPPLELRSQLVEAERQGDIEDMLDLARDYAEATLREAELWEKIRSDALAERLIERWKKFTNATGDQKIAASLTVAWCFGMARGR